MSSEATRRCDKCEWWVELQAEEGKKRTGQCRRLPPLAIAHSGSDNDGFIVRWPLTLPLQWCGEFQLRGSSDLREAVAFARAGLVEAKP